MEACSKSLVLNSEEKASPGGVMASRMQNHGGCTEGWVVDTQWGYSFNEHAVQERHPSQQRGEIWVYYILKFDQKKWNLQDLNQVFNLTVHKWKWFFSAAWCTGDSAKGQKWTNYMCIMDASEPLGPIISALLPLLRPLQLCLTQSWLREAYEWPKT